MSSLLNILNCAFVGVILACMLFGGYVVLAGANIRMLLQKSKVQRVYLHFTVLMFIVTSIYIAVLVYMAQLELIEAPVNPQDNTLDAVWPSILTNTLSLVNILLTSGLLAYRCFVVWDDYRVAAVPGLVFLAIFGTGIACVWAAGSPVVTPHTTRILNYPFWISIIVLNVLTTSLISARLLQVRKSLRDALGGNHGRHYVTIISMLVESAAIELLFAVLAFATFAADVPVANVFAPMEGLIVVIAPNLLIYRVASGSSIERTTIHTLTSEPASGFISASSGGKPGQSPVFEKMQIRVSSGQTVEVSQGSKATLVSYEGSDRV